MRESVAEVSASAVCDRSIFVSDLSPSGVLVRGSIAILFGELARSVIGGFSGVWKLKI